MRRMRPGPTEAPTRCTGAATGKRDLDRRRLRLENAAPLKPPPPPLLLLPSGIGLAPGVGSSQVGATPPPSRRGPTLARVLWQSQSRAARSAHYESEGQFIVELE